MGPESQLVGHNFQQEFLSELETGMELLQTHAQLVLGNALSHAIQGVMEALPTESVTVSTQGDKVKVRLELHWPHIIAIVFHPAAYHLCFPPITLSIAPPDGGSLGKCVRDQRFSDWTGSELLFQPAGHYENVRAGRGQHKAG